MSIHVMNRVWRESPAKGSELLLLLAIADFADDDGVAWPGVETLARKARLSKRQTQYNIRSLIAAGLLSIEENAGKKGTHRYRVELAPSGDAHIAPVQNVHRAKSARGGAKSDQKGVQPIAPEPSIEPSGNHQVASKQKPTQLPVHGPAQQIVKAFCDEVGIPKPVNYGKTVGQAQQLVDAGVTPDDIPDAVKWCEGQKWLGGSFDLGTILSQADKWRPLVSHPKSRSMNPADYGYHGSEGLKQFKAALERGEIAP